MLAAKFGEEFEGWEDKLKYDEWYFCNLRDSLITGISSEDAFHEIGGVVELALKTDDEFLYTECFELLIALARKSNTTEAPESITKEWESLREKVNNFGEYQRSKYSELSNWYRRNAL